MFDPHSPGGVHLEAFWTDPVANYDGPRPHRSLAQHPPAGSRLQVQPRRGGSKERRKTEAFLALILTLMSSTPERDVSAGTRSTTIPVTGASPLSSTGEASWWARNVASISSPAT